MHTLPLSTHPPTWAACEPHTPPVLRFVTACRTAGTFSNLDELAARLADVMRRQASSSSSLDGASPREGFVARCAAAIPAAAFGRRVAKYVRAGHVQTDGSWRRTWKAARVQLQAPPPPPPAPLPGHAAPEATVTDVTAGAGALGRGGGGAAAAAAAAGAPGLQATAAGAAPAASGNAGSAGSGAAGAQPEQSSSSPAPSGSTSASRAGTQQQRGAAPARGRGRGGAGGGSAARLPKLVMLVGLPGSGKSTFGRALATTGR